MYVSDSKRRSTRLATKNIQGCYQGPTASHDNFWHWPVTSNIPHTARHVTFDEMRYGLLNDSPNSFMIKEKLCYLPKADK